METAVTLQPPFEYSLWVPVVFGLLLAAGIVLFVIALFKLKSSAPAGAEKNKNKPVYQAPGQISLFNAKRKYISQIQLLLADYSGKKISKRDGYQRLSLIIREFTKAATGIDVTKATLRDLRALNLPMLNSLIEEYYVPEFGEEERARDRSLEASCDRAMGVIKAWN